MQGTHGTHACANNKNSKGVSLQQSKLLQSASHNQNFRGKNKWYRTSGTTTTPTTSVDNSVHTYYIRRTPGEHHAIRNTRHLHAKNKQNKCYSRYDPKHERCPILLPLLEPIVAARVAHHSEDQLGRVLLSEGFRLASPHGCAADDIKTRVVARARLALVLAHVRGGVGGCRGGFRGGDR